MRQDNNKRQKHASRGVYGAPNEYDRYEVSQPAPLLEWLLAHVKNSSKTKIKQILQDRLRGSIYYSYRETDRHIEHGSRSFISSCKGSA